MTGAADKAKITSASAFNSSGMASYATQASPFLQAGTSASPSPFASAAATSGGSVFGSAAPSLSNTSTVSPFGGIVGLNSPFGGVSASPFGGVTGTKLSSFAQPGTSLTAPKKPAKPFGAPDSESDDDDDGDDSPEDDAAGDANGNDDGKGETDGDRNDGATAAAFGDSKGPKLQRVVIEDGEEHEATLLQIRAKLYYLDKASGSVWKERGAGNLKINVPIECVETEEATGSVYPNTFDASALADSRAKNARLIMRQDSTHRVILNTAIIPALTFKEFSDLKATRIIFTAYEPEGAVSVTIKVCVSHGALTC
ncbi:hypothetical protein F5Y17DRAFT_78584 [Xylariaceae sp. FL0594]|nr:hypothetical protein F5Y17DRAFT_78584 [Xylariaceae sp. FL0594]